MTRVARNALVVYASGCTETLYERILQSFAATQFIHTRFSNSCDDLVPAARPPEFRAHLVAMRFSYLGPLAPLASSAIACVASFSVFGVNPICRLCCCPGFAAVAVATNLWRRHQDAVHLAWWTAHGKHVVSTRTMHLGASRYLCRV